MWRSILLKPFTVGKDLYIRNSCNSISKKYKVALIGATGGVGQPLSLLLKLNPIISELRLHDLKNTPGVASDLAHIETATKVTHSNGKDMGLALKGCVDVIICTAGLPRKPGIKREDLFDANAQVAFDIAKAMAEHSPEAILLLITNPINSIVPIACEVLKNAGKLNKNKIIGVTTLDSVRAATFIGELSCIDPKNINVPIIGGHSAPTIIPLLSRSNPALCIDDVKQQQLIKRIQEAGTEVVKAKAGTGSATLSMAYAASRLTYSILRAFNCEPNIIECGYVASDQISDVCYLATPILLGQCGIEKNLGIGSMSDYEKMLFCKSLEQLKKDIALGEKFVKEKLNKKC